MAYELYIYFAIYEKKSEESSILLFYTSHNFILIILY